LVLTKTNLNPDYQDIKDYLIQINPSALLVEAAHQPLGYYELGREKDLLGAETLKGKTLALFSGIADPDSFENLILSLGAEVGLVLRFPDHHHYARQDIDRIIRASRQKGVDAIITTEKDAVKLRQLFAVGSAITIFVLRITLKITQNEKGFSDRLLGLYCR
jgi:tetraacyldisaccharide 4'-kinase